MHPWLPALFGVKKRLSDIEYLAIKEFDGKLVHDDLVISAVGDIATLTASSGKDMYLAAAKIAGIEAVSGTNVVLLKVNGTEVERFTHTGSGSFQYEFKSIGLKVAATEIIKIEWTVEGNTGTIGGFIECIEEDTDASPQI